MTRIAIVEDDHLQEGPLAEHLELGLPDVEVESLATELDVRRALDGWRTDPPDAVVLDVMLRWADPAPDAPEPPPDVVEGGYYRAGLRCAELLAEDDALRRVPVVLYTILERSDLEREGRALPPNSTYVGKGSDMDAVVRALRRLLGSAARR